MTSKRRSMKRMNLRPDRKTRQVKFLLDTRVYDILSALSGPQPLVGTVEKLVERAFDRELKKMGFDMPSNEETTSNR